MQNDAQMMVSIQERLANRSIESLDLLASCSLPPQNDKGRNHAPHLQNPRLEDHLNNFTDVEQNKIGMISNYTCWSAASATKGNLGVFPRMQDTTPKRKQATKNKNTEL